MKLNQIKKILQRHKGELEVTHSVKALYVFGSVARNEAKKKSDIDIIVEFSSDSIGLFEFADLKIYLESILKSKVDLVTREAIREVMRNKIERDSIRVA